MGCTKCQTAVQLVINRACINYKGFVYVLWKNSKLPQDCLTANSKVNACLSQRTYDKDIEANYLQMLLQDIARWFEHLMIPND